MMRPFPAYDEPVVLITEPELAAIHREMYDFYRQLKCLDEIPF